VRGKNWRRNGLKWTEMNGLTIDSVHELFIFPGERPVFCYRQFLPVGYFRRAPIDSPKARLQK
jgi:hypothetical protein